MKKIYLVDFDGTISVVDTLVYISTKFYPLQSKIWSKKIKSGEYNILQWLKIFEETFNIDEKDYLKALDDITIDPFFKEFAEKNEVRIVSGGFTYNIDYILRRNGIQNVKIYANTLEFIEKNKIRLEMNYLNESCILCGVCKRDIYYKYKKEYDWIVYIGDGITDVCVAEFCDEIYALKGYYLEDYLTTKGTPHKSFKNFSEII